MDKNNDTATVIDLDTLVLAEGAHDDRSDGLCVRSAARSALTPTVAALQSSALALLDRMLAQRDKAGA